MDTRLEILVFTGEAERSRIDDIIADLGIDGDDELPQNVENMDNEIEDTDLPKYIRSTFPELGAKRKEAQPRNALSAFSNVMEKKMELTRDVEVKKIALENDKFEYMKSMDAKAHELQVLKVT